MRNVERFSLVHVKHVDGPPPPPPWPVESMTELADDDASEGDLVRTAAG